MSRRINIHRYLSFCISLYYINILVYIGDANVSITVIPLNTQRVPQSPLFYYTD